MKDQDQEVKHKRLNSFLTKYSFFYGLKKTRKKAVTVDPVSKETTKEDYVARYSRVQVACYLILFQVALLFYTMSLVESYISVLYHVLVLVFLFFIYTALCFKLWVARDYYNIYFATDNTKDNDENKIRKQYSLSKFFFKSFKNPSLAFPFKEIFEA